MLPELLSDGSGLPFVCVMSPPPNTRLVCVWGWGQVAALLRALPELEKMRLKVTRRLEDARWWHHDL